MIGDWVRIDEPDKYAGATGQIQSLMYHREGDSAYFHVFIQGKFGYVLRDVCSDDIRPITLTAEILEKNLATEPQIAWCVGWNKKDDIHVEIKRDDLNAAFYGVIDFVHQLQHALRLCGIEKTIEL